MLSLLYLAFMCSNVLLRLAASNLLPNMQSLRVECPCVKPYGQPIGKILSSLVLSCIIKKCSG